MQEPSLAEASGADSEVHHKLPPRNKRAAVAQRNRQEVVVERHKPVPVGVARQLPSAA